MPENKTQPTDVNVEAYIAAIVHEQQRLDCQQLLTIFTRLSKEKAVMWGPSIIGFGVYHYRYDSGREGDMCRTGFAARKGEIAIYLMPATANQARLLAQLGKHKMGKSCLSIKRLSDIQLPVLEHLIVESLAAVAALYGK